MVANATLNGVNSFTLFGVTYAWSNKFLQSVAVNGPDSPGVDTANLTLAGSDWHVRLLEFNGSGLTGTIADGVGSTGNRITLLRLGDGPTDVTLTNTRVAYIEAQSDSVSRITLGNQETRAIDMQNGDTTIIGGIGFIRSIRTGDGNDSVSLQGGADQISLGSGNNTITTASKFVGSITMYSNAADLNTITVGSGGVRSIGVSDGRDRVTLLNDAFVEQMFLGKNNDTLTLRAGAFVQQADMGDGTNTVTVGSAEIHALTSYGGIDTVTLTTGSIQSAALGSGNNVINVGNGRINTLLAYEGNDTVKLGNAGEVGIADLSDGTNTVTLAGDARIAMLKGGNGDDIITLSGTSRIFSIKVDGGNNVLTTADGNVESFYSYGGNNTLNIGAGGIQQIVLSGAAGVQTITSAGWIGSLQSYQSATNLTTGAGGATFIYTSSLADTITTGTGRVNFIGTFSGNDIVTMGTGGIGFAELRDGDDLIKLNASNPAYSNNITGGNGIDTADFSQFAVGVTYSLAVAGALQNVAGLATIGLSEFENLTGTALADALTGSDVGNVITGGLGADSLIGLAGADVLIGGKGNDSLTGGADADTFQFNPGDGRDRISDFVAGVDLIEFTAATSMANVSFTKFGTGVLLKVGTAEVVVENITVAVMNDVDNFLF